MKRIIIASKSTEDFSTAIECFNIDWNTDGEDASALGLPESVIINNPTEEMINDLDGYGDSISDYLSDEYGYLVNGYVAKLSDNSNTITSATDIGKQDWVEVYKADVIKYGGLLNCIKEGEYSVVDENRIRHQANFGHGTMEDYMKHIKSNKNYWIFIDTINQKAYNYNGKINYSLLDRYRQIYEH